MDFRGLVDLDALVVFVLRARNEAVFFGAVEDGEQAVVIALEERVSFVIVAAGAADGEAKEDAARGRNDIVELVGAVLCQRIVGLAHVVVIAGAVAAETGGDEALLIRVVDFIARDLLGDETGIRFVVVEAADDVVAVFPRMRAIQVVVRAAGVGVTREIQPVAAPALAVVRALEQAVDEG